MGKKNEGALGEQVDELIGAVGEDRKRLTDFLDNLISQYDGDQIVGIAEYVAKLAEALTRQHHVKVSALKVLGKHLGDDEDDGSGLKELSERIGMPFEPLADDGN